MVSLKEKEKINKEMNMSVLDFLFYRESEM